ncbi:MAG: hypothetical protein KJ718_00040 [Nanoarchaeota archaeon]|nr:hypothetical protein [Nanoarchaeota archaeon]MBU1050931.1 hypothetical protein [Nanoarchaeota archaeon]MBU1988472.1 hypothetical protein [Nanoarchaeota archaeon]
MEIKSGPIVEKRKLITSGSSVVLAVPKRWLEENGLVAGGEVIMIANGNLEFMKATPENIARVNQRAERSRKSFNVHEGSLGLDKEKPTT